MTTKTKWAIAFAMFLGLALLVLGQANSQVGLGQAEPVQLQEGAAVQATLAAGPSQVGRSPFRPASSPDARKALNPTSGPLSPHDIAVSPIPTVWVPPIPTIHLNDSGWSEPVGLWYPITRTAVLTQDVNGMIQLDVDHVTLVGNSHVVTGEDYYDGVYFYGRTDITIANLSVRSAARGIHVEASSNITVTDNTVYSNTIGIDLQDSVDCDISNNKTISNTAGISLMNAPGTTVTENVANGNLDFGIALYSSLNNTIKDNTVNSNGTSGFYLEGLRNGTLANNVANSNGSYGIHLAAPDHSILTGNTANANGDTGIYVNGNFGTTLVDNTANLNQRNGIYLFGAEDNTITGNTMSGNRYNFSLYPSGGTNSIDTTNLIDGKPVYYIEGAANQTFDASLNAGALYLINASEITVTGLTVTNDGQGVVLFNTRNSRIEKIQAANDDSGILVLYSQNITVTNNTFISNSHGIITDSSAGNRIYNNDFLSNSNTTQIEAYDDGDLFALAAPIGGNYWSDWTAPDSNRDGFVDNPYVFTGGQDNLPWTTPSGWLGTPTATPTSTATPTATASTTPTATASATVTPTFAHASFLPVVMKGYAAGW